MSGYLVGFIGLALIVYLVISIVKAEKF